MAQTTLLPRWADLAQIDDADFPLLSSALLIAQDEYPDLDADRYLSQVASHAAHLQPTVDTISLWPLKMAAINRYLFHEIGYSGYRTALDPRNCYLNEVFDRRLGSALSLAIVQIEVAHRLGIPLEGLSLSGHFFVRLPVESGILIMDPFNRGRPLGIDEIRDRVYPLLSATSPNPHQLVTRILNPSSRRGISIGILEQLHAVYTAHLQWDKAARCADRILRLCPNSPDALRNRGLAYLALGHHGGARQDLEHYLSLRPGAEDALAIRDQLINASSPSQRYSHH